MHLTVARDESSLAKNAGVDRANCRRAIAGAVELLVVLTVVGRCTAVEEDGAGSLAAGAEGREDELNDAHVQVGEVQDLVVVEQVHALDGDGHVHLLEEFTAARGGCGVAGDESSLSESSNVHRADSGAAGAVGIEGLQVLAVVGAGAGVVEDGRGGLASSADCGYNSDDLNDGVGDVGNLGIVQQVNALRNS